jgi:hypothetical protein
MHMTFFIAFTWNIQNQPLLPSDQESNLLPLVSPELDSTLYFQLVGSLLYLTQTHPNLSFVVGIVSQYMKTHHESHWKVAKRIHQYV